MDEKFQEGDVVRFREKLWQLRAHAREVNLWMLTPGTLGEDGKTFVSSVGRGSFVKSYIQEHAELVLAANDQVATT